MIGGENVEYIVFTLVFIVIILICLIIDQKRNYEQILSLLFGNMRMHYTYADRQLEDIVLTNKSKEEIWLSDLRDKEGERKMIPFNMPPYVGTENGVNVLVGNKFFPLQGADGLMRNRIRGIESYKDGILVATAYDGLFYCDGHGMSRFETGIEDYMRENEIFCMAKQGSRIALGTIHHGLLVLDAETMAVQYYNEYNKLSNNTVLSFSRFRHYYLFVI